MDDFFEENDLSMGVEFGVRPYQFEPLVCDNSDSDPPCSSENESTEDEGDDEDFFDVTEWCECDRCINMPTLKECRCCRTMNVVDQKVDGLECVTQHEGFIVNCLNIHVLETSYYEYVINKGPLEEGQQIHELYRYLAYRRFTRWVYGLLVKKSRKVIPSCAVNAIRGRFPSEAYCGFKYPQ